MLKCEHRKDLHWIFTLGGFQQSSWVWERCLGCLGNGTGMAESTTDGEAGSSCLFQPEQFHSHLHHAAPFHDMKGFTPEVFKRPIYFNFSVLETKKYKWRYSIGPEALCWTPDLKLTPVLLLPPYTTHSGTEKNDHDQKCRYDQCRGQKFKPTAHNWRVHI